MYVSNWLCTRQEMACVVFSLPPTVNRCYWISWLFTNLAKVTKHLFLGVLLCQCSTVWRVWGWGGAAYHAPKVVRGSSNQMAAMGSTLYSKGTI